MNAKEFVKALDAGDFESLLGDRIDDFFDFLKDAVESESKFILVRCSVEDEDELMPYYVWVVYRLFVEDEDNIGIMAHDFYLPTEGEYKSYYEMPPQLKGLKMFSLVINDEKEELNDRE